MNDIRYYCKGDNTYHYESELPKSLRPSTNKIDFDSFNRRFKNAIKQRLPIGYKIHSWNKGCFYCSGVIETPQQTFIYMSIDDVRFDNTAWFANILIRTMAHDKDWTGGPNRYTTLFTFTKDIQKLYQ